MKKAYILNSFCSLSRLYLVIQMSSALILGFTSRVIAQGTVFKAGASTVNITPFLSDEIVGNYIQPPAVYVHDELHARSLVLDDGSSRLVFVVVDNVGVSRQVFDAAKQLLFVETKIPLDHMMMSSTHTHSATSAGGSESKRRGFSDNQPLLNDYQIFLARRIADGVRNAIHNLQPSRIGWGAGQVPQHLFNRRWIVKSPVVNPLGEMDAALMNPGNGNPNIVRPAGPTDPEVSFVTIQALDGRPIAVLANYSLHYVGGMPGNHISADYFGAFADRLQELLKADRQGVPFVGIMSNGTSGDVNNVNVAGKSERHPPYAKMRIVADDVAQEVLRVMKTVEYKTWVPLKAAQSELNLQVRKPGPELLERCHAILKKPVSDPMPHPLTRIYAERVILLNEYPDNIDVIIQAFRIGDLAVSAIPFEVLTEIGLDIKAKSPFKSTFTIELANGSYGYLPSPAQHKLGGYETWLSTNRVQTDASDKIIAEVLKLFQKVK
jgi:hypothetical protein